MKSFYLNLLVVVALCLGTAMGADPFGVGMNMEKRVNDNYICAGEEVTYTLITRMINGGPGVQLRNIVVTDTACTNMVFVGGDANNNGVLDFGEEFTNQCSLVLSQSHTNVASDSADVYLNGAFIGIASNQDSAAVTVVHPAVTVTASPANQQVAFGGDVDLVYTLENTGDVALFDVGIQHTATAACNQVIPHLAVGEVLLTTCRVSNVQADFMDMISVTGLATGACAASAAAFVDVELTYEADVDISISTVSSECVCAGTDIPFTVTARNTGDVPLNQVVIVASEGACDRLIGDLPVGAQTSFVCSATVLADFTNIAMISGLDPFGITVADQNSARVAVDLTPPTIVSCPADLIVSCLADVPPVDTNSVQAADVCGPSTVRFVGDDQNGQTCPLIIFRTYEVADACGNTSNCTQIITVDDRTPPVISGLTPQFVPGDPNCMGLVPVLNPSVSDECGSIASVVQTPLPSTLIQGPITIEVSIVATDLCGNAATSVVPISVSCDAPGISIDKTVSVGVGTSCPGSERVVLLPSELATYCFTVLNTGAVNLSDVTITDDQLNMPPIELGALAVNQSITTSVVARVDQSFVNVATVVGRDPGGEVVTDNDPAEVVVVEPGIQLEKRVYIGKDNGASCDVAVDAVSGFIGQDITYCFVVSNTGDTHLDTITLDDPMLGITDAEMTLRSGTTPLAPGAEMVFYYETILNISTVNVASVVGNPVDSQGVDLDGVPDQSDSDDARVDASPVLLGLIAGTVYFDANDNGAQTTVDGEFGFTNVTVTLVRNGVPIQTQQTDDEGDYVFPNLPAGRYVVVVTPGDVPNPFELASNFSITNSTVNPYIIVADEEFPDVDFGFLKYGSISGSVWYDTNQNGAPDENLFNPRIGVNGAIVRLFQRVNGVEVLARSVTTATDPGPGSTRGFFLFDNVLVGDYRVAVDEINLDGVFRSLGLPSEGRRPTTPVSSAVTLTTINCDDVRFFGFVSNPTYITLAQFVAVHEHGNVRVNWTTGTEVDNFGFHVYRSDRINGQRIRITRRILPAENASIGASYSFMDAAVPGGRYFYWLEDVDTGMNATVRGPAVVVVPSNVANVSGTSSGFVEGLNKVSDEVLRAAGLDDYEKVCVLVDGIEVPAYAVAGVHIIFHVPAGTRSVEFGLSDRAARMQALDVSYE